MNELEKLKKENQDFRDRFLEVMSEINSENSDKKHRLTFFFLSGLRSQVATSIRVVAIGEGKQFHKEVKIVRRYVGKESEPRFLIDFGSPITYYANDLMDNRERHENNGLCIDAAGLNHGVKGEVVVPAYAMKQVFVMYDRNRAYFREEPMQPLMYPYALIYGPYVANRLPKLMSIHRDIDSAVETLLQKNTFSQKMYSLALWSGRLNAYTTDLDIRRWVDQSDRAKTIFKKKLEVARERQNEKEEFNVKLP